VCEACVGAAATLELTCSSATGAILMNLSGGVPPASAVSTRGLGGVATQKEEDENLGRNRSYSKILARALVCTREPSLTSFLTASLRLPSPDADTGGPNCAVKPSFAAPYGTRNRQGWIGIWDALRIGFFFEPIS